MNYSYEQIGTVCATFACADDVKTGEVCRMHSNCCVCRVEEDGAFEGVVMSRRGDCATVAVQGFVTVPYTGTVPPVGYQSLIANELGGVYFDASGNRYLVVDVDETNNTVTFML